MNGRKSIRINRTTGDTMVRESGISATKPSFPRYLLPSFTPSFLSRRRSSKGSDSSEDDFVIAENAPSGYQPNTIESRLTQTQPDTLRCLDCSAHLAYASQIISKGFTGRHGKAFLVAPPSATKAPAPPDSDPDELLNIRVGRSENRQLVTGWHTVADISCGVCDRKIGWKYVDAREASQKYKVGKFILETERVVTWRSWERVPVKQASRSHDEKSAESEILEEEESDVSFDSGDEEECENLFAGRWDAEAVAERRRSLRPRQSDAEDTV